MHHRHPTHKPHHTSTTDCGGDCPTRCASTKRCYSDSDCAADTNTVMVCDGTCRGTHKAETPATVPNTTPPTAATLAEQCSNGIRDGQEMGVDCGAACSTKCPTGTACATAKDCASGACLAGVCSDCINGTLQHTRTDTLRLTPRKPRRRHCGWSLHLLGSHKLCLLHYILWRRM